MSDRSIIVPSVATWRSIAVRAVSSSSVPALLLFHGVIKAPPNDVNPEGDPMDTLPILSALLPALKLPCVDEVSLPAWREKAFSGEDD